MMQGKTWKIALTFLSVLLLSGCGSVDPWSLIPSSERVFIEMAGNQNGSAEPISVDELLRRASGEEEDEATIGDRAPEPIRSEVSYTELHFTNSSPTRMIELKQGHLASLESVEATLAEQKSKVVVIEVPAFPPHARIAAYRRAAAIARYFELRAFTVEVRPSPSLDADKLRVGPEESI